MSEKKSPLDRLRATDFSKMTEAVAEKIPATPILDGIEAAEYGRKFVTVVSRLKGVRIDRDHFLRCELSKAGVPQSQIETAVRRSPAHAMISEDVLTAIAKAAINFETNKSSMISFTTGLPGGLAMLGAIPADLTQYYVHAFRIMQKLAYLYGWQEFLSDAEDMDDETLAKLALFLGVMTGVGGAANNLTAFAHRVATPAIQKRIASAALTRTAYYPLIKRTLGFIGVKVTRESFAKSVSKVVPVVGGVVSGAMTYATLRPQSERLRRHLASLPQARTDIVDAEILEHSHCPK